MTGDSHPTEQAPGTPLKAPQSPEPPIVGTDRRPGGPNGPQTGTESRGSLRDQIAEALMAWAEGNNAPQYASVRRPETVRQNAYGRADAVLAAPAVRELLDQQEEAEAALELYGMLHRRAEAGRRRVERVREACAQLKAAVLNADGQPLTPRDEGVYRAVRRVLAALDEPKEQP